MKIVTIGSFKGGTGKTTLCAVLGTALTRRGIKTRIIELETSTKPLARFEAAREFADLESPTVHEMHVSGGTPNVQDWQMAFRTKAEDAARQGVEVLLIDAVSVWKPEVIAAHLVADLIITTVTESPVDLYQIMPTAGPSMQASRPYSQLIDLVRQHAHKYRKDDFNWFVCLNRKSHLITRVGESVRNSLQSFCEQSGTDLLEGLVDRVGYRIMMETGVTPVDDIAGEPVQRSYLAARTESRRLASQVVRRLNLQANDRAGLAVAS